MKDSTKSIVAGIIYSFAFHLISWSAFAIPDTYGFEYAIFIPMIVGLLGIPIYFILRNHFDQSVLNYRLAYWSAHTIFSIVIFSVVAALIEANNFDSWYALRYDFAFLLIGICGMIPLFLDLFILACKAFWRWLGDRSAI